MSITMFLIDPSTKYIDENWGNSEKLSKRICARGVNLLLAPAVVITCALDIILGLGATVATLVTLGINRKSRKTAKKLMLSSERILSDTYLQLLKFFNPQILRPTDRQSERMNTVCLQSFFIRATDNASNDRFVTKHINSRIFFALYAVSSLINSVAEISIGIIAASFSIITLGQMEDFNTLAYKGFKGSGVIFDLFLCSVSIINPQAFT